MGLWSYIGLLTVIIVLYKLISQLGKSLPILELMLTIAGLQWIVGPIIEYSYPSIHYKYYMYVDQYEYMEFVVPAYLVFTIVILFKVKKIPLELELLNKYSKYGVQLLFCGLIFDLLSTFISGGGLGFILFILSNFKYVGAIILFYSNKKTYRYVFYLSILFLLMTSILNGLFHDFILWSVFFYMFWARKNKPSYTNIILTTVAAVFLMTIVQTIKSFYRFELDNNYQGNKVELFFSMMYEATFESSNQSSSDDFDDDISNNVRLNQGWIISAIIDNIPKNQDFFKGQSRTEAIEATIVPRFLNPNKKKAGGQDNFRRFTGLTLNDDVSMGISIIGEAYGNYNQAGGIIFMGIWGLILVGFWNFLLKKIRRNIVLVVFLPVIYLQVIKAETELVVVLNHLIKSTVLVFLFLWFSKKVLNLQ